MLRTGLLCACLHHVLLAPVQGLEKAATVHDDMVIEATGSMMRRQHKAESTVSGLVSAQLDGRGGVALQDEEHSEERSLLSQNAASYLELNGPTEGKAEGEGKSADSAGDPVDGDVSAVENAAVELLVMERKNSQALAKAFAYVIIGMVLILSTVIYLTNAKDPDILGATWRTLSDSIGLFAAILIFFADKDFYNYMVLGEEGLKKAEKSKDGYGVDPAILAASAGRVVINYFIVMGLLYGVKGKKPALPAIGCLGGHIMAFTMADFFGNLQAFPPFNSSPAMSLMTVPVAFAVGFVIRMVATKIRAGQSSHEGEQQQIDHDWAHQCEHTEDEFIAFSVGLLLSQTCRFALTGYLPPIYGYKKKKKFAASAIWGLLGCGFGFGGICVAIAALKKRLDPQAGGTMKQVYTTLEAVFAMGFAWCLHFWGKWCYYAYWDAGTLTGTGAKIVGKVYMALATTPLAFGAIVLCDMVSDRVPSLEGLKHWITALCLLIGLAWEKTFMQGVTMLQDDEPSFANLAKSTMTTIMLCAFVIPAWAYYILPRAMEHSHGHGEGHGHGHGKEHGAAEHAADKTAPEQPLKDAQEAPPAAQEEPPAQEAPAAAPAADMDI